VGAEPAPGTGSSGIPTDRLDSAARAASLDRINVGGAGTYLPAMLAENDSVLHRWAGRARQPLRVAVLRGDTVRGFQDAFVANVAWAIGRWNGVGLPVWLEQSADSTGADIVVTWVERLDGNRTGRSDLTWQRRGPIVKVRVTLATHLPDGRPVQRTQMVALALHELGHAIGLGHSPVKSDALYPETSATDLTPRDRSTATLLYSVPPGSLK
jgi:predicted Zn-dependent protease